MDKDNQILEGFVLERAFEDYSKNESVDVVVSRVHKHEKRNDLTSVVMVRADHFFNLQQKATLCDSEREKLIQYGFTHNAGGRLDSSLVITWNDRGKAGILHAYRKERVSRKNLEQQILALKDKHNTLTSETHTVLGEITKLEQRLQEHDENT